MNRYGLKNGYIIDNKLHDRVKVTYFYRTAHWQTFFGKDIAFYRCGVICRMCKNVILLGGDDRKSRRGYARR